jgi:dihydrofolate reductase
MTRTRYYTASSIDGFIADDANSLDWLFAVQSEPPGFAAFFEGIGAFAMGATTYEWVLEHEQLLAKPDRWTQWYGDTPGWVFTHRDLPRIPGANVTFVNGAVSPVHQRMVAAAGGKDIWLIGGGALVGAFADQGLLDEINVQFAPATLGAGAPLLPRRLLPSRLSLHDVTRIGQFVQATYHVGPLDSS